MANDNQQTQFANAAEIPENVFKRQAGKKWYRVTVYYYVGNEVKAHFRDNCTGAQVLEMRSELFAVGLMVYNRESAGEWLIVPPQEFKLITVTQQAKFFEK